MSESPSSADHVDLLLENARLRDALEPYVDDSLDVVDMARWTTREENEFLASLLAWEWAPVLPIAQWFQPELILPAPETLDDEQLRHWLWEAIRRLYEKRIVIEFTDHLTDRQLYTVIFRDILPAREKRLDSPRNYLHWRCIDPTEDSDLWLRYYATEEEREAWSQETGEASPAAERPPCGRRLPRRPL